MRHVRMLVQRTADSVVRAYCGGWCTAAPAPWLHLTTVLASAAPFAVGDANGESRSMSDCDCDWDMGAQPVLSAAWSPAAGVEASTAAACRASQRLPVAPAQPLTETDCAQGCQTRGLINHERHLLRGYDLYQVLLATIGLGNCYQCCCCPQCLDSLPSSLLTITRLGRTSSREPRVRRSTMDRAGSGQ